MAYDAIVIGAGHNGLAAAVHLASRGWRVGVFERAAVAGGAVKTAEITAPGFRHDLYAMNLSLFAGSPFLAAHREGLTRAGLAFVPADHAFATPFPDGTWLGVSRDIEATAARIARASPLDAERWRTMAARFPALAPTLFGILGAPMPSASTLRTLWQAWRGLGPDGLGELGRLLFAAPRDFLDRHFDDPQLKAMMAAWGLHLDFPPDAAGGALFPYLESMANQTFGMVIGAGGADTMIRALTGHLAALGGEIHLGQEVTGIETRHGLALGIRLADGTRVQAAAPSSPTSIPGSFSRLCWPAPARRPMPPASPVSARGRPR